MIILRVVYLFSLFDAALLSSGLSFRFTVTRCLQRLPASKKIPLFLIELLKLL